MIVVALPSKLDEENARKFQVYRNYVQNMSLFLRHVHGEAREARLRSLVQAQFAMAGVKRIQRKPPTDMDRLRRYLMLSWTSETQLALGNWGDTRSTLQYSNAWAPVHAYYAVYGSVQAWLAAQSHPAIDDHTAVLKAISTEVTQRCLLPSPWSVACCGCPQVKNQAFVGLPDKAELTGHLEMLAYPTVDSFWDRYTKMLSTTRERQIEHRIREWKRRQNRKRATVSDKNRIAESFTPTTIFDFLWRMRVRSNYRDVESFLVSYIDHSSHLDFHGGLRTIVDATCLLLESVVCKRIGPNVYRELLADFRKGCREDDPSAFLLLRQEILAPRRS